eukprot:609392-Hanusia_phi.AAC.1
MGERWGREIRGREQSSAEGERRGAVFAENSCFRSTCTDVSTCELPPPCTTPKTYRTYSFTSPTTPCRRRYNLAPAP